MVRKKIVNGKLVSLTAAEEAARNTEEQTWSDGEAEREVDRKKDKRKKEYGNWQDQLDMIWHDINTNGQLDNTGDWFAHIETVKNNNPL